MTWGRTLNAFRTQKSVHAHNCLANQFDLKLRIAHTTVPSLLFTSSVKDQQQLNHSSQLSLYIASASTVSSRKSRKVSRVEKGLDRVCTEHLDS